MGERVQAVLLKLEIKNSTARLLYLCLPELSSHVPMNDLHNFLLLLLPSHVPISLLLFFMDLWWFKFPLSRSSLGAPKKWITFYGVERSILDKFFEIWTLCWISLNFFFVVWREKNGKFKESLNFRGIFQGKDTFSFRKINFWKFLWFWQNSWIFFKNNFFLIHMNVTLKPNAWMKKKSRTIPRLGHSWYLIKFSIFSITNSSNLALMK